MPDLDAQSLADHAVMIGLVSRPDARLAMADADDGTVEAVSRSFLRKGLLTSWQLDRLQKGDPGGFFYGGCKVLFHLAEGTFARVYRGVREGGTPVAVKVLRNRFVADAAAVDRFHKEAEAGMKLRHPNIVRILDYGEEDKKHYMIMEYVEGANLRDFLKIRTKISGEDAIPLMIGLAKGLKYSFEHGVTHRDIKATNILISNAGEAKLVDFGLAGLQGEDAKASMTSQRTVDYSALERTCGSEKGDPRSDIYFLGCVFYHMITGQAPMKESESKDMLQKMLVRSFNAIVPLGEHRLAPDPLLAHVIERMMKVDLKARYQNMDDVLAGLEKYGERVKAGITGLELDLDEADDTEVLLDFDEVFAHRPGTGEPSAGAGAAGAPGAAAGPGGAGPTGGDRKPSLLCVEAQESLRDALRKSLAKMGYRVILVGGAELAAERYRESSPDAVIFDLDGLGPDGVAALTDMHETAHEDGRPLSAVVLLGPRQSALRSKLPADDRLVVLSKPLKMKHLQAAVVRLVPA